MVEPEGRDYDVQAAALLETANGVVHFEALAHPLRKIGFLRDGWDERVEINGVDGRLDIYSSNWTDFSSKPSLLVHYDNASGASTEHRFDPASPFDNAVTHFCSQIEKRKQGPQSILTGYETDELIEHIKLSASRHQAVDVAWRG